jgi:aldose 1-epimerase
MDETHSITGLKRTGFQKIVDGKRTNLFILANKNGLEMTVTNYGAKIVSLSVPDKSGKLIDVVTGHNNIDEYLSSEEPYFGAVCGRTGNRIAKGTFTLDGKTYTLAVNNGPNNLHGGIKGFNAVVWDAEQLDDQTLKLTYLSKDGEEGFPGNLTVTVTYKLTDDNAVQIDYRAITDQATIVNLTNHSYFNLSGAGDPYVGDHLLQINADAYLPTDETAIPYGKPEPVEGTPMDFRQPTEIGLRINDNFQQLIFGKGYDHTYVLNKKGSELSFCAKVKSPKTGITMDVYTTEPGVQLYTSNWTTGNFVAKNGQRYPERCALCLETQHFPDSINKPEYPSVVLRPGEIFESQTIFKFSK